MVFVIKPNCRFVLKKLPAFAQLFDDEVIQSSHQGTTFATTWGHAEGWYLLSRGLELKKISWETIMEIKSLTKWNMEWNSINMFDVSSNSNVETNKTIIAF